MTAEFVINHDLRAVDIGPCAMNIVRTIELRSFKNPFPLKEPETLLVYLLNPIDLKSYFAFIEWFPKDIEMGKSSVPICIEYLQNSLELSEEQRSSLEEISARWGIHKETLILIADRYRYSQEYFKEKISEIPSKHVPWWKDLCHDSRN